MRIAASRAPLARVALEYTGAAAGAAIGGVIGWRLDTSITVRTACAFQYKGPRVMPARLTGFRGYGR